MRSLIPILVVVFLAMAIGCSGGAGPTLPVPESNQVGEVESSHITWGLWQFTANPAEGTLDIVQLRSVDMHLNALPFLEPPPFANLTLESLEFIGDLIEVDIGLRHPFLGLDEFTGFDVCGILITNGSITGFSDSDLRMAGEGDTRLLNPDGYSRWWNPHEFPHGPTMFEYKDGLLGTPDAVGNFNSTLNAYKFFCDELDNPDDPLGGVPVESRCVFAAGMKNVRHYTIELGAGLVFNYAIDANWQFPTGGKPWEVPDDFPPEANRPEAWNIDVTETHNTLWNNGSGSGGMLSLLIDVWDHYNAGLNILRVESPGNFSPVGPLSPIDGGPGYSTYQIDVTSATPAPDSIEILIQVESEVTGYGGLLPGKPVMAYFTHSATVLNEQPADLTVTSITPDHANQHEFVDDAIISGTGFNNVNSVRLEKDTDVIESGDFNVDSEFQITADFDLAGYTFGLYDVVVEVDGGETGVLEDGFEIIFQCGSTAPEFDDAYTLNVNMNTAYVSAILNAGPYEGYTIFPECNVVSGGYRVYDHMNQADDTPITNWSAFQAYGNALLMEPGNNNDLMIVCPSYKSQYLQVINQETGALVQELYNLPYLCCIVGDFDGDDDFWGIVVHRPSSAQPNIYEYYLQHWAYNSGAPSSPYSFVEQFDVTSLFRDDVGSTSKWEVFGDLVMEPSADYCFVLTGTQGTDEHRVDKLDLTGGSPAIIASYSFTGEGLDGDGQIDIAQSRSVKMELDVSDIDNMPCRLVVAGSSYSGGQYSMKIYRFDTDLNLLDSTSTPYNITTGTYTRKFYGMALDMENGVISHLTEFTWGDPESYYGISTLPADW